MTKNYITSYNQSGGITAHTVNMMPPARKFGLETINSIKQRIPIQAKVKIYCTMGDSEAYDFARQIFEYMKNNGYSNLVDLYQSIYNVPFKGELITQISTMEYKIDIGSKE